MNTDSWAVSAVWGRVGAAILSFVALVLGYFGYSMGADEQEAAFTLISSLLAGVAGVLALVSKIRETKKKNG